MRGLLSAAELDRTCIDSLLIAAAAHADGLATRAERRQSVVGLMFFEDSLRTRVGFETAAARLGIATTVVSQLRHTAEMAVAESFEDTVRCVAPWCDALLVRHPDSEALARIAIAAATPVINCGSGADEHPTQALIDLFAVQRIRGSIDGLRIALVGDLAHMRSAHSLLLALRCYDDVTARCIAPRGLQMPESFAGPFRTRGGTIEVDTHLRLDDVDIVYVAGLPRTSRNGVSLADQDRLRIDRQRLSCLSTHARVLCPLPRVDEIAPEVDTTPHAAYFEQSALGLPMRMAVLERILGPPAT